MRYSLPVRIFLALMVASCLGCSSSTKQLRGDIQRLENSISDMRSLQAEQTTNVASLRADFRRMEGRLQMIEHGGQMHSGAQSQGARLPRALPTGVPKVLLEKDLAYCDSLPFEPGSYLRQALQAIQTSRFEQARNTLERSLTVSADQSWAPPVLFWRAVTHELIGDNAKALSAYHELVTTFPKLARSATALYRQGNVFLRLGDRESAKLTFQKLEAQYPRAAEASQARARLKEMR